MKIIKDVNKLHHFFKTAQEQEFNFPIKVVINNVNIPIIIILNFFVTTDYLQLSQKFLNFQQVFLDEANKISLTLENKSDLPQKFGFIMLPREFTVKPNIETILAKEKTTVDIIYESQDNYIGHREGDIVRLMIILVLQSCHKRFNCSKPEDQISH